MISLNDKQIIPTIFPDKTSQVWKLEESLIKSDYNKIVWQFENESEFIHLAQLTTLLKNTTKSHIALDIPYFPYARQDKPVDNKNTFALHTFCGLLDSLKVDYIRAFDIHSNFAAIELKTPFINIQPDESVKALIEDLEIDLVVFPDKGAKDRYQNVVGKNRVSYFEKIRDQSTGDILGIKSDNDDIFHTTNRILIVDDLCDGGATFTHIAKYIRNINTMPLVISLYTSHGLYSKGTGVLFDNGIDELYNKNGQVTKLS